MGDRAAVRRSERLSLFTQLLLSGASTVLQNTFSVYHHCLMMSFIPVPVTHVQSAENDALAAHERSCTRQLSAFAKSDDWFYCVRNVDRNATRECLDLLRQPGSSQERGKERMKCFVWRGTTHLFTVRPLWLSLFFSPTFSSVISLNIQTRGSLFVRRKSPDCWSKPVKSMHSWLCVRWRSSF